MPGLIDQNGDAKAFGGRIWPMPEKCPPGRNKHSTFYHRDRKLVVSTYWNSDAAPNCYE